MISHQPWISTQIREVSLIELFGTKLMSLIMWLPGTSRSSAWLWALRPLASMTLAMNTTFSRRTWAASTKKSQRGGDVFWGKTLWEWLQVGSHKPNFFVLNFRFVVSIISMFRIYGNATPRTQSLSTSQSEFLYSIRIFMTHQHQGLQVRFPITAFFRTRTSTGKKIIWKHTG